MNESRHILLRRMAGFTLVEAVVAIVITGILAVIVARFITAPVKGYVDSVRRAALADAADASLRRIARDVRMALPNSLRVSSSTPVDKRCIEFIPVIGGGRYRIAKNTNTPASGNLFITGSSAAFNFDALVADGIPVGNYMAGDFVVVNNLGTGSLDAYQASSNKRSITNVDAIVAPNSGALTIELPIGDQFASSPGHHFQVIPANTVVYSCPGNGDHNLYRTKQTISTSATLAPLASCPTGSSAEVLVSNVTSCSLEYGSSNASATTPPRDLLMMTLVIADPTAPGETVQLFNEVHVNNAP